MRLPAFVLTFLCCAAHALAQNDSAPAVAPKVQRVIEFQGEDVDTVVRSLARQANLNVLVSSKVPGTGRVYLRLVGRTPREVLEMVCEANDLVCFETGGIWHIQTKAEEPDQTVRYRLRYCDPQAVMQLLRTKITFPDSIQFDGQAQTIVFKEKVSKAANVL